VPLKEDAIGRAQIGEKRNACRLLVGKPVGKRPTHKWVDNIKMDLGETECGGGVDWIGVALDRD
jgi:hypothetical protein